MQLTNNDIHSLNHWAMCGINEQGFQPRCRQWLMLIQIWDESGADLERIYSGSAAIGFFAFQPSVTLIPVSISMHRELRQGLTMGLGALATSVIN